MGGLKGKSDMDCPKIGCGKKVSRSTLVVDEELQEQIQAFERRKRKMEEEEEEGEKLTQRGRGAKKAKGRGGAAVVLDEEEVRSQCPSRHATLAHHLVPSATAATRPLRTTSPYFAPLPTQHAGGGGVVR